MKPDTGYQKDRISGTTLKMNLRKKVGTDIDLR